MTETEQVVETQPPVLTEAVKEEILETIVAAVPEATNHVHIEAVLEAQNQLEEKKEKATRLVPIELRNVSLRIDLRVAASVGEQFEQTQTLIARLREKFGQDALIEELSQVVSGVIEKVTIVAPQASQPVVVQVPEPVQVSIPQTAQDFGDYQIQSTRCPWHGNNLRSLEAASIYKLLYEAPQQSRDLMTAQDLTIMAAYYKSWYDAQMAAQNNRPKQTAYIQDDIPF